jgi:hypothetical protein
LAHLIHDLPVHGWRGWLTWLSHGLTWQLRVIERHLSDARFDSGSEGKEETATTSMIGLSSCDDARAPCLDGRISSNSQAKSSDRRPKDDQPL